MIDENGVMLGLMSSFEALRVAEGRGLDLIEIAPKAKPPACKIMDYGKWKYESKKKDKASKKKQTVVSIKEIQVRPRTENHDLETKLRHARRFLMEGSKVKVNLRFSGREMAHQDLGVKLLNRVVKILEPLSSLESPPKREGRQMFVLVSPDAMKMKEYKKSKEAKEALSTEAPKDSTTEAPKDSTTEAAKDSTTEARQGLYYGSSQGLYYGSSPRRLYLLKLPRTLLLKLPRRLYLLKLPRILLRKPPRILLRKLPRTLLKLLLRLSQMCLKKRGERGRYKKALSLCA